MKIKDLHNAIRFSYGLSNLEVLKTDTSYNTVQSLLSTKENKLFFLKGKAFFLKENEFKLHIAFQQFLHLKNGSIPDVYKTVDGNNFVSFDNRLFELIEWIPNTTPIDTQFNNNIKLIGNTTGKFLKDAMLFSYPEFQSMKLPNARFSFFPETPNEIFKYLSNNIDKVSFCLSNNDLNRILSDIYEYIRKCTDIYSNLNIPLQFIHGDLFGGNCISDGRNCYIIDFDTTHWGFRLSEISYISAIIGFFDYDLKQDSHSIVRSVYEEKINMFLHSLCEHIVLSSDEKKYFKWNLILSLIRAFVSCYEFDDDVKIRLTDEILCLLQNIKFINKHINL